MLRIIKHMPHACQAVTEAQPPDTETMSRPPGGSSAANKLALMDQWPLLIPGKCGGGISGWCGV